MHLSLDVSPFSDPFLSINLCCFFMVSQEGGAEDATVVGVTSMDCHWNLNGRKESFAMDLWTSIPLVLQVYYIYIYTHIIPVSTHSHCACSEVSLYFFS